MNTTIPSLILTGSLVTVTAVFGGFNVNSQTAFANLDFEAAMLPVLPPGQGGEILVLEGIPGWSAYIGIEARDNMLHNTRTLGAPGISIFGPDWPVSQILQGNYTVFLAGSVTFPMSTPAIGQNALIPSGMQSIQFFANFTSLEVTVDGQVIPFVPLAEGANYTVYGADISMFAGQIHDVRFSCPQIRSGFRDGALLDAISFSAQPVPEPSTVALIGIGGLALGFIRLRFARLR
jgi:hypothetical protein